MNKTSQVSKVAIIYVPSKEELVVGSNNFDKFQKLMTQMHPSVTVTTIPKIGVQDYFLDDTHLNAQGHRKLFDLTHTLVN